MGGKRDSRTFMVYPNMNDPKISDFIMFLRYYLKSGSPELFAKMRAEEIARK